MPAFPTLEMKVRVQFVLSAVPPGEPGKPPEMVTGPERVLLELLRVSVPAAAYVVGPVMTDPAKVPFVWIEPLT